MSKKTSSSDLKNVQRKRCFFDIDVSGTHVGRIIFELFNDICPKTCENFRALCTGEKGSGLTTNKKLYYKGSPIHRVVRGFIIQGGDFSSGDGTGGESIFGGCFTDEYLGGKHDKPFLLSMANRGKDTNGSQFFITCASAPHLDGKHVVFGQVIQGFDVVKLIENLPTDDKNRPLKHVNLAHCGELIMKIKKKRRSSVSSKSSKSSSSSSSDSSSGSSSSSSSESSSSSSDTESEKEQEMITNNLPIEEINVVQKQATNEEDVFCSIKPGEVPTIPVNNFLMRRSNVQPTNQQVAVEERENLKVDDRNRERQEDRRRRTTKDAAGRKVKGRGFLRFNTRRSRSRSRTPVHWRRAAYDRRRPEQTGQKSRTTSAPNRDFDRRERSQDVSRERETRKGRKSDNSEIKSSRHDRRSTSKSSKEPTKAKEKRSRSREEKSRKNKHGSEESRHHRRRRRSTSRSREKTTSQRVRSRSKSAARSGSEPKRRSRTRSTGKKRDSRSNTRSRS